MSQTLRAGSLTIDETLAADGQPAIYFRSTRDSGREFFSLQAAQGMDTSLRINKHNAAGEIVATGVLKDTLTYPVDDSPTFAAVTVTGNVTVAGSVNSKLDVVRLTSGGPITAAHFGKYLYAAPGNWSAGLTLPVSTTIVPGTSVTIINNTGAPITENTTGRLIINDVLATFIWHRETVTGPYYWISNLTERSQNTLAIGKLDADPNVALDVSGSVVAATVTATRAAGGATSLTSAGKTVLVGSTLIGASSGSGAYTLEVAGTARTADDLTVGGDLAVAGLADVSGAVTVRGAATLAAGAAVSGGSGLTVTGATDLSGAVTVRGAATLAAGTTTTSLSVSGPTTLSGTATVAGAATLSGGAAISGGSGLLVTGATDLSGAVTVRGLANLAAGATVGATGLTVTGPTTLSGGITLSGTNTFSGAAVGAAGLTVTGPTTLNGTTSMVGAATIGSAGLTVGGPLNVDSGTLYVDSTNNRVGVGTTVPEAPLHVKGTSARLLIGQTTNLSFYNNDAQDRGIIQIYNVNGPPSRMSLNPDGGQVTVGNISSFDNSTLAVQGLIRSNGGLNTYMGEFDNQPLFIGKTSPFSGGLYYNGPGDIGFASQAIQNMILRADGRVGIVTQNPVGQLHVSFGKTTAQDWIISEGSVEATATTAPGFGWYGAMIGKGMSVDTTNTITVHSDGTNAFGAGIASGSQSTLDFFTAFVPGATSAALRNMSELLRMRILADGKVGIGTGTPATTLDVSGVARATSLTFRQNAADDTPPIITYRAIPAAQGGQAGGGPTELMLFHSNDAGGTLGPDRITLRAPEIHLQTYDNSGVTTVDSAAGANDRLVINPTGAISAAGDVTVGGMTTTNKLKVSDTSTFSGSASFESSVTVSGTLTANILKDTNGATIPLTTITGSTTPAGAIMMWSGINDPPGWLVCDGRSVQTSLYPALAALIRGLYGTPPSDSTFLLPDMRSRFPVGVDTRDTTFDGSNWTSIGRTGGQKSVTLTIDQMPAHTHTYVNHPNRWGSDIAGAGMADDAAVTQTSGSTGGGMAHENRPPFFAINYIIKY